MSDLIPITLTGILAAWACSTDEDDGFILGAILMLMLWMVLT